MQCHNAVLYISFFLSLSFFLLLSLYLSVYAVNTCHSLSFNINNIRIRFATKFELKACLHSFLTSAKILFLVSLTVSLRISVLYFIWLLLNANAKQVSHNKCEKHELRRSRYIKLSLKFSKVLSPEHIGVISQTRSDSHRIIYNGNVLQKKKKTNCFCLFSWNFL